MLTPFLIKESLCYKNNNFFIALLFYIFYLNSQRNTVENETSEVKSLSHVQLFATPWTVAHQTPPSMEFSRQEYWSGLPFLSPGRSSQPRDRTQVSCIVHRHSTVWATREVKFMKKKKQVKWCLSVYSRYKAILTFPLSVVSQYCSERIHTSKVNVSSGWKLVNRALHSHTQPHSFCCYTLR